MMSDLPQIETDVIDPLKLRIAAMTLSGVIAAFVSYWISYGVHSLFEIFAHSFAHAMGSWVLSILIGVVAGLGAAYWVYQELSTYIDS